MKITIDLNNPADVQAGLALLQSVSGNGAGVTGVQATSPAPTVTPTAPAAPSPQPAPAPASSTAPAPSASPAPTPNAAPAPAPAPAAPPASAPAPAPAPSGGAVNNQQFTAAVNAYAKAHGPQAAKAKLAECNGATKISDIPAEHYAHYISWFAV